MNDHTAKHAEIVRLTAEIEALKERAREVVGPFAAEAAEWAADIEDSFHSADCYQRPDFTVGQYRAAATFMNKLGEKK